MKTFLALTGALLLAACADTTPQTAYYTGPNLPYAAYQTTGAPIVGRNNAFANWSTPQLQERRRELYSVIPRQGLRNGDVAYVVRGTPLPQQDELKLVEGELNRRFQAGDRAAQIEPFWNQGRRHPG